jgi:DsbC/DsbD-like thiol-disulfide interchange protein
MKALKIFAVCLFILLASFSQAQLVKPDPPVKATFVPAEKAKAGTVIETRIDVEIQKDWHLFSERPEVPGVAPTQVQLDNSETYTVKKITLPKPTPVYSDVFQKTLNFYENKISIPVQIELKSDVKGDVQIKGTFRYQSCSKVVCLPPTKLPINGIQKING